MSDKQMSRPLAEIDPQVATFLASKMNYSLAEGARKIRADKTIEGRMTYIHLAGDLDGSFPREKLAEGLEGDVIIDLAGIGKIDPAGAAEWRQMMRDIAAPTDRIFLHGCPPVFVERLTKEDDLGGKAQVLTLTMPYTCARSRTFWMNFVTAGSEAGLGSDARCASSPSEAAQMVSPPQS